MKITSDKLEISSSNSINWMDVQAVRLSNDRLVLIMVDDSVVELSHLSPLMVDRVFRTYESYLQGHPDLKVTKERKRLR